MTQLVKKDSSWRTLRRKAVVGASSFALVAGMGVALAPAAMAADPVAPTVTVTVDPEIANDGTAATIKVEIKTGSEDADALDATTDYQLAVKVPEGLACASGAAFPNVNLAKSGSTPGTWTAGGTAPNCTLQLDNTAIPKATTAEWTFTVKAFGHKPAAGFTPAVNITGDVTATFAIAPNGGTNIVSGTASSKLVAPTGPSFNTDVPAPTFGSIYNYQLIKDAGFPPADSATDVSAVITSKNASGTWVYDGRAADVQVGTGDSAKYYVSLNDKDFDDVLTDDNVTTVVDSMSGFFLETVSGNIVYGTIKVTGYASHAPDTFSFTQRAVNTRGVSTGNIYVYINNGYGGATTGTTDANGVPGVSAGDVVSAVFNLNVNFSDVPADGPFTPAINALSSANPVVIQGFGDGTFGATQNVTRGEFAAFVFRTLKNVKPADATIKYTCDATTPSQFTDVANNNVFCESVNYLASVGVINGTSATTFAPNAKVTRDQAVAFLYRLNSYVLGQQVGDAAPVDTAFNDVKKNNIFSGDIAWGSANNIVNGRSATVFAPADNVLRQEAAAFIYRYGHGLNGVF